MVTLPGFECRERLGFSRLADYTAYDHDVMPERTVARLREGIIALLDLSEHLAQGAGGSTA
jgi:hypothetical protein